MAGLLQKVAGGFLKGMGEGAMLEAKQRREDAIAAAERAAKVEDRDAGFAQRNSEQQVQEGGLNSRSAATNATSITNNTNTNQTSRDNNEATNSTSRSNNAATIAGEASRQKAGFTNANDTVDKVETLDDGTKLIIKKGGASSVATDADGNAYTGTPGLNKGDATLLSALKQRNQRTDSDGRPIAGDYDWANIDKQLRATGREKLADTVMGITPEPKSRLSLNNSDGASTGPTISSLNLKEAPASGGGLTNPTGGKTAPKTLTPPPNASKGDAKALPALKDRIAGKVYPLPSGNFKWTATGWEPQ